MNAVNFPDEIRMRHEFRAKFPRNVGVVISKTTFNDKMGRQLRLECHATACRALSWPSTLGKESSSDGAQGSTEDALRCETRLDRRRPALRNTARQATLCTLHAMPQSWRREDGRRDRNGGRQGAVVLFTFCFS